MPPSSYSAGRFLLNLDGTLVGLPSLGGGSITGEVVTYRTGSGTVPVKRIAGVFARLETPVDFEALDDQPVDLVFLLLAPEGAGADHLKALSRIARVLRDADTVAKIRGTRDAVAIHALLSDTQASHAA